MFRTGGSGALTEPKIKDFCVTVSRNPRLILQSCIGSKPDLGRRVSKSTHKKPVHLYQSYAAAIGNQIMHCGDGLSLREPNDPGSNRDFKTEIARDPYQPGRDRVNDDEVGLYLSLLDGRHNLRERVPGTRWTKIHRANSR